MERQVPTTQLLLKTTLASDGVAKLSSCSRVSDSVLVMATSGGFPTCVLRTVEVSKKTSVYCLS